MSTTAHHASVRAEGQTVYSQLRKSIFDRVIERGAGEDAAPIGPSAIRSATPMGAAAAEAYLQSFRDIVQQYSVHGDAIDWPAFRAEVMETAGLTRSSPDITAAIAVAL